MKLIIGIVLGVVIGVALVLGVVLLGVVEGDDLPPDAVHRSPDALILPPE